MAGNGICGTVGRWQTWYIAWWKITRTPHILTVRFQFLCTSHRTTQYFSAHIYVQSIDKVVFNEDGLSTHVNDNLFMSWIRKSNIITLICGVAWRCTGCWCSRNDDCNNEHVTWSFTASLVTGYLCRGWDVAKRMRWFSTICKLIWIAGPNYFSTYLYHCSILTRVINGYKFHGMVYMLSYWRTYIQT